MVPSLMVVGYWSLSIVAAVRVAFNGGADPNHTPAPGPSEDDFRVLAD